MELKDAIEKWNQKIKLKDEIERFNCKRFNLKELNSKKQLIKTEISF